MTVRPLYVRMFQVQAVFGVHKDTVRKMAQRGLITIHKCGRMSYVRTKDMFCVLEGSGG